MTLFRILTIRKHKTVTFCEVYSYELFRSQMMINNSLLAEKNLVVGTILNVEWHDEVNRSGNNVIAVDTIVSCIEPNKNMSYKSFEKNGSPRIEEEPFVLEDTFANELNGGIYIRQQRFYLTLLQAIRNQLERQGMLMLTTPITTKYRGTSVANPAKVMGEYIGEKYIKITHELELKKKVFTLLMPVFELGYVVRDRYVTQTGRNEFLTLEAVTPQIHDFDLEAFYKYVMDTAIGIANDLELEYNHDFDSIEVIDVKKEYEKSHVVFSKETFIEYYEAQKESHKHVMMLHVPLDSPLGLQEDDCIAYELQWNYRGHGIGHGYVDEYRVDRLRCAFEKQQAYLKQNGIDADMPEDYLRYCEYAGIPTFSFNIGIERFFEYFFDKES